MSFLRTAIYETRPFLESTRNTYYRFSGEIQSKIIEKLSQNFSRTESAIWVLCEIDEFFFQPKGTDTLRNNSGNSWNADVENQKPTGDPSQKDPHADVGSSVYQSRHSVDSHPDEAPDNVVIASALIELKRFLSDEVV